MKRLTAALTITLLLTGNAFARPDVRTMSCAQAQYLVQNNGAVVFTFTNNTYDRVVKSRRFCDSLEEASETFIVRTKDTNRCVIGKKCIVREPIFERGFR